MSELVVIAYDTEQTDRNAFNELSDMQRTGIITLTDAALAVKDQKGKVKVKRTRPHSPMRTRRSSSRLWNSPM